MSTRLHPPMALGEGRNSELEDPGFSGLRTVAEFLSPDKMATVLCHTKAEHEAIGGVH